MNIYTVEISDLETKYFKSDTEAIEYAIDDILDTLSYLLEEEYTNMEDAVKILNLIKNLQYDDAIEEFNELEGVDPILIDDHNIRSYKNNIKDSIEDLEDTIKKIVFK